MPITGNTINVKDCTNRCSRHWDNPWRSAVEGRVRPWMRKISATPALVVMEVLSGPSAEPRSGITQANATARGRLRANQLRRKKGSMIRSGRRWVSAAPLLLLRAIFSKLELLNSLGEFSGKKSVRLSRGARSWSSKLPRHWMTIRPWSAQHADRCRHRSSPGSSRTLRRRAAPARCSRAVPWSPGGG